MGSQYRERTDLVLIRRIWDGSTNLNVHLAIPEDQGVAIIFDSVKEALSRAS
jgi:hypothetical protein